VLTAILSLSSSGTMRGRRAAVLARVAAMACSCIWIARGQVSKARPSGPHVLAIHATTAGRSYVLPTVVAYFTVATVVQSGVRDEQALVIGDVVVFRQNLSAGPIDDLAYPKLGYRQRLTTWKATCPSGHTYRCKCDMVRRPVVYLREKRMDGAPPARVRAANPYSLRVSSVGPGGPPAKPCARRATNRLLSGSRVGCYHGAITGMYNRGGTLLSAGTPSAPGTRSNSVSRL